MNIKEYIESFYPKDDIYETIDNMSREIKVPPSIGLQVAEYIGFLIRTMRIKNVLDIGTCLGYSAIAMAKALRETGGKLISIEIEEKNANIARSHIVEAGFSDIVTVINRDAAEFVANDEKKYDLICQDSAKWLYPKLLDRTIEMLNPGGILIADDALFLPMGFREESSKPIDEYNRAIFADKRFRSIMLPIGDGITVSWLID